MELTKEMVEEFFNRLVKIFSENKIECSKFSENLCGRINLDLEEYKAPLVRAIYEENSNVYKQFCGAKNLLETADYFFQKNEFPRNDYIDMYWGIERERELENWKVSVCKGFIKIYDPETNKTGWSFPKTQSVDNFYDYSKNFLEKYERKIKIINEFKTRKLIIPETTQKLNLEALKKYYTKTNKVTFKCRGTNYQYISITPEKIWKYYYLSSLIGEPLLIKNQETGNYEEIKELYK